MQPHLDNNEDQDGSEASVFVESLLSLYPVISIDHNFAENPSPFFPVEQALRINVVKITKNIFFKFVFNVIFSPRFNVVISNY